VLRNPLPRPRDEAIRVSDAFAAVKRALWTEMQAARSPATAASPATA
jgi:hypothetical protein